MVANFAKLGEMLNSGGSAINWRPGGRCQSSWRGSKCDAVGFQTFAYSVCNEFVDNPDYDDSRYNEYPIGNLNAAYRCFPTKPFHGFPPIRPR